MVEVTLTTAFWVAIGFLIGRAFFKQIDYYAQETFWFDGLPEWQKIIVKGLLDFTHHWWVGLALYLYAPIPELQWVGIGLFVNDWPDIPKRFRKYFQYLFEPFMEEE